MRERGRENEKPTNDEIETHPMWSALCVVLVIVSVCDYAAIIIDFGLGN